MASGSYMLNRKRYGRPQAMLWSENPGTLKGGLYVPAGYEVGADLPEGYDPDDVDQFIVLSDHNRSALDFGNERIEQRERMINGRMRSYYIDDKLSLSTSWDSLPSRSFAQKQNWSSDSREAYILDIYTPEGESGVVKYEIMGDANPFAIGDEIDVYGTNVTGWNVRNAEITDIAEEAGVHSITISNSASGVFDAGIGGMISIANSGKSPASNNFNLQYTVDGGAGGLDLLEWYENHTGSFWVFLAYDKFTNFGRDNENDYKHLNQYNEIVEMYISDFSYTVEKRGGIYDLWNVSISLEEV